MVAILGAAGHGKTTMCRALRKVLALRGDALVVADGDAAAAEAAIVVVSVTDPPGEIVLGGISKVAVFVNKLETTDDVEWIHRVAAEACSRFEATLAPVFGSALQCANSRRVTDPGAVLLLRLVDELIAST